METSVLRKQIKPAFTQAVLATMPKTEAEIAKNYKIIPTGLIIKADWNFKTDDQAKAQKLLASVKRSGQIINSQVRLLKTGYYELVDGNHRKDVYDTLGTKFVLAYDHGEISANEAKLLALQIKTEFDVNRDKTKQVFQDLLAEFDFKELDEIVDFAQFDGLMDECLKFTESVEKTFQAELSSSTENQKPLASTTHQNQPENEGSEIETIGIQSESDTNVTNKLLHKLKFGVYEMTVSEEEYHLLESKYLAFTEANKTNYGFVTSLFSAE